ncbi:mediator of RNA polymerase II transcription subunit 30-like isoform X3 [Myxocyprinus asiaticus]|uniref:mediator of RNA polymerase II transcription subunit 30-like isoform X3 n=1 Tax=Myxocyprinus asiaticus TaxID=70543 RepID=UPI002222AF67|nr:mediator of RNA polymerase II transcription subunit 30-like isoform X3 [Myxocyprinus asiaticus]
MTTPPLAPFSGQQAQAARDVNTASLCRIGQETVQDIVLRTMEIFQLLRNMQLPNGVTYHPNTHQDRLGKLQEHLRTLSVLFRKLRLVYDKCNENCAGLDPIPPEKLKQKNQQLKMIMDQLRNLIWEINSMLSVRS